MPERFAWASDFNIPKAKLNTVLDYFFSCLHNCPKEIFKII